MKWYKDKPYFYCEDGINGRKRFVEEVLSPLLVASDTNYISARYDSVNDGIFLTAKDGYTTNIFKLNGCSLKQIVLEVFKYIQ
jgi:hypothetical protein